MILAARSPYLSCLLLAGCASLVEAEELDVPEPPPQPDMAWVVVPDAEPDARPEPDPPPEPGAPPTCDERIAPMREEDGTSPRQRAMFAARPPKQPWPQVRAWLASHGVTVDDPGRDLGPALGVPGYYRCDHVIELAEREVALCTRSFIVDDADLSTSDWVLLVPTASGLAVATVGTHEGGVPPPRGMTLGPYVRLDLDVDPAEGGLTLDEAAPGTCAYACGHAAAVEAHIAKQGEEGERSPLRPTAVVAELCASVGRYVLRGTEVERISGG